MHRPYTLINAAMTLDGKLDTVERRAAMISSSTDWQRVDRLRAAADAVMVGGHTLLQNDPRLTVKDAQLRAERLADGRGEHPTKVAVVSRPNLRPDSRFLTVGPARRILFTTALADAAALNALRKQQVEVFVLGETRVDLVGAMARLVSLGIHQLLVEGGGTLIFELLRLRLVDELRVYVAPLVFGGSQAPTLADGAGLHRSQAISLERRLVETLDDGGLVLHYRLHEEVT
jgi:2,5-diamino-6-(ribosylamino)-4(3H)-pyrimidinone 5'-phosphate reductase